MVEWSAEHLTDQAVINRINKYDQVIYDMWLERQIV